MSTIPQKKNHIWLALLIVLASTAAGYWYGQKRPGNSEPGKPVSFTLQDVDGNSRSSTEWDGKIILINFWATWCPPCREEIPLFALMQEKYRERDFAVIGVALEDAEPARLFGDSVGMNYTSLVGQREGMALMRDLGNKAGSIPFSVIVDREGVIRATKLGEYHLEELENVLSPLL